MIKKINFKDYHLNFENYNSKTQTLTIENVQDDTYFINFENFIPNLLTIQIIHSNVSIVETFKGNIPNCQIEYNIDNQSKLQRCSIIVETLSEQTIIRNINNNGFYQSMQIDLTKMSTHSEENIHLNTPNAFASVKDGIYAMENTKKIYQTNLNHYQKNCISKAQIFAVNDDNAHVSIFTDAYIKNGATGTKTNQEGRIINLSTTCYGIVLPNLHIDENDVEASHSCSVGSVNQDHMYYLESRGLSTLQARNILIRGYFNPILENLTNETIKNEIITLLEKRIG